ncbi:MAG: acylphosphatase [Alphaproteobacteria bacterium]|nr:acylphosphatase [Alphaproteobacteria bacterium]
MTARTVRAVIKGKVQGVWYRGWTVETARRLGLLGWVRNRGDGSVEALFHGAGDTVAEMIEACHRGPPAARVLRIDVTDVPVPGDLTGFEQRPSA